MNNKRLIGFSLLFLIMIGIVSCDDNNDTAPSLGSYFVSISGESSDYVMQFDSLTDKTYSINQNIFELETQIQTWLYNDDPSTVIGLVYNQSNPGVGIAIQNNSEEIPEIVGEFQIGSRFTNYGFFGDYAVTSVGGQAPVAEDGSTLTYEDGTTRDDGITFNFININDGSLNLTSKTIATLNITGNGEKATNSGIVDLGNGEFFTALVCSQAMDETEEGGSSSGTVNYPDSVWVAALDEDLNVKRIYRDNRISYASGRYRSRYYNMISKDENDDIYVFSGSYESTSTLPCGALRIKDGATEFDQNYYFNIEELTDNYHFRRLWYISKGYFLLVFYNEYEITTSTPATQFGLVNVYDKTFSWISNFPTYDQIADFGEPMVNDNKMYLPVKLEGYDPAIYVIDPSTASATRGAEVDGATNINAIYPLSSN